MGIVTVLIIAIALGLLGAFFSSRAGIHSLQVARRHASWTKRRKLMAEGWRFFGLAFLLIVLIVAGPIFAYKHPDRFQPKVSTPGPTVSPTPLEIFTNTSTPSKTLIPTNTPNPTDTPADTFTPIGKPSRTPRPEETRWPTLTPSETPTQTLIPSATRVLTATPTTASSATNTLRPSRTPLPTDTHWPTQTPTSTRTATP